ncbi:hypothetical protein J4710_07515 [Staphylococcus xylosus]|uniref:Uncharacterized protein n=1 Tax=Staphylococcus xylosus TaxID=1288 RepID=A0A939NC78_STAXY|nr:hypothetical protein [Staphylococcus xylosus]
MGNENTPQDVVDTVTTNNNALRERLQVKTITRCRDPVNEAEEKIEMPQIW